MDLDVGLVGEGVVMSDGSEEHLDADDEVLKRNRKTYNTALDTLLNMKM